MRIAPMAEWKFAPRKDVVGECLLGVPASKAPDGVRGFAAIATRRSSTSPKGVPSEAHPNGLGGEVAEHCRVLAGGALKEAGRGSTVGVDGDELGPCRMGRFAKVWKSHSFVGRTPDWLRVVVEVGAEHPVKLAGSEHEVEGNVGGYVEVSVHGGDEW